MFLTQLCFAAMATWIAYATYTLSMVPQIRLNFKRKSANGLSDLFLLGLLNRNVMWVGYIFALGLPMSYKVMGSVLALVTLVLAAQRVIYAKKKKKVRFFALYGINTLVLLALVFWAAQYSLVLGHCLGWINIALGFVNEVPQVAKMHKKRACKGFSFNFVLIGLCAYCFEFFAALVLHFPFQVLLCSFKGIVFRSLFIAQFVAYRRFFLPARLPKGRYVYAKKYWKGIAFKNLSFKKKSLKRLRIKKISKQLIRKGYLYDFVQ